MKKLVIAVLVLMLLLGFSACGRKTMSNDPNVGKWTPVAVVAFGLEMKVTDFFPKETSIELKADGTCVLMLDGKKLNAKWSLQDNDLTISGWGIRCTGSIRDGVLRLLLLDSGIEVIFEKASNIATSYTMPGMKPENSATITVPV
jgi:hypothetical protein